jgi:hypothetical protein
LPVFEVIYQPDVAALVQDATMTCWMQWISERYLESEALLVIRGMMEQESNIELPNFLRKDVFEGLSLISSYVLVKSLFPSNGSSSLLFTSARPH